MLQGGEGGSGLATVCPGDAYLALPLRLLKARAMLV